MKAVADYTDPNVIAEVSMGLGEAMKGIDALRCLKARDFRPGLVAPASHLRVTICAKARLKHV